MKSKKSFGPKLACADFTFPLLAHEQAMSLVSLLQFDGIDIGLFEGRSHLWPSREFKDITRSGGLLKRKAADRGLQVADLFLQMSPDFEPYAINHTEPARRRKARDWFLKTLDYAGAAECRHVTCLPGVPFAAEPRAASFARSRDELAWRLERAQEHGVTFSIEGHVGSIAPKPGALLKLVNAVPGLTLTLDYTHFTRIAIPDAQIEPLLPHASHFHVRGARRGRLQAPFKSNTIDYARVLQVMRETGYSGYVGIEYVWIDWEHCNEVDNIAETVLFRDFVRNHL